MNGWHAKEAAAGKKAENYLDLTALPFRTEIFEPL
jgi:hypothetical protein